MTLVIKVRGAPSLTTVADYWCPEHERFEANVLRTGDGDAPDHQPCPECGASSEWCISAPMGRVKGVEAIKGKWTKPERKTYTDTRNLGEGQPLYEWKEDRAAIWEERRKADVMKFAKEH